MIGASAEMAPTAYWLKAGADVLWIDKVAPPLDWQTGHFPGRLYWPTQPIDLLTQPESALAALMAFADSGPMHLGLYAYAPGAMREVLLTGVMNAIVDALPADAVETVSLLLSPTTPTELDSNDQVASQDWWSKRPAGSVGCAHSVSSSRPDTIIKYVPTPTPSSQFKGQAIRRLNIWVKR